MWQSRKPLEPILTLRGHLFQRQNTLRTWDILWMAQPWIPRATMQCTKDRLQVASGDIRMSLVGGATTEAPSTVPWQRDETI